MKKSKNTYQHKRLKAKRLYNCVRLGIVALSIPLCSAIAQSPEGQPKLYEPYAPKPSGKAPEGWEIKILEGSQVENSTNLNGKKEIKVTVPAYELIPKLTEETVVLKDPGFDPKLATSQRETIGAVLTDYSEKTIELQTKLDKVIEELEKSLGASTEETANAPTEKKGEDKNVKKTPNNGKK